MAIWRDFEIALPSPQRAGERLSIRLLVMATVLLKPPLRFLAVHHRSLSAVKNGGIATGFAAIATAAVVVARGVVRLVDTA